MQPSTLLNTESIVIATVTTAIRSTPMLYIQLAVLTLWVFLFVYLRKLLQHKNRALVAFLFVLLATSGLMLAFKYTIETRVYLKTNGNNITMYSGPGSNCTILGQLPANEELIKLQESGAFVKARYKGATVWIGIDHVKEIK